jgi:hypothetical protein
MPSPDMLWLAATMAAIRACPAQAWVRELEILLDALDARGSSAAPLRGKPGPKPKAASAPSPVNGGSSPELQSAPGRQMATPVRRGRRSNRRRRGVTKAPQPSAEPAPARAANRVEELLASRLDQMVAANGGLIRSYRPDAPTPSR